MAPYPSTGPLVPLKEREAAAVRVCAAVYRASADHLPEHSKTRVAMLRQAATLEAWAQQHVPMPARLHALPDPDCQSESVWELGLTERTASAIVRAGIGTVRALRERSAAGDLAAVPQIGPKALAEISAALHARQLGRSARQDEELTSRPVATTRRLQLVAIEQPKHPEGVA